MAISYHQQTAVSSIDKGRIAPYSTLIPGDIQPDPAAGVRAHWMPSAGGTDSRPRGVLLRVSTLPGRLSVGVAQEAKRSASRRIATPTRVRAKRSGWRHRSRTSVAATQRVVPPPPSRTPFRPTTRAIDSQRIDSARDDELLLLALRFEDDSPLSDQAINRHEIEEDKSEEEPLAYEEAFASLAGQV